MIVQDNGLTAQRANGSYLVARLYHKKVPSSNRTVRTSRSSGNGWYSYQPPLSLSSHSPARFQHRMLLAHQRWNIATILWSSLQLIIQLLDHSQQPQPLHRNNCPKGQPATSSIGKPLDCQTDKRWTNPVKLDRIRIKQYALGSLYRNIDRNKWVIAKIGSNNSKRRFDTARFHIYR